MDFTATEKQISLHGLGFLQVKLPGARRMHVWHPELPRRQCATHSSIHNHRFSFRSTVLVGTQVNRRYDVVDFESSLKTFVPTHHRISHNGPRSEKGGRLSYRAGQVIAVAQPDEIYKAGESYEMPAFQYHETPSSGIVVTIMEKLVEKEIPASTLIHPDVEHDQHFDRFQLSDAEMWAFVVEALKSCES